VPVGNILKNGYLPPADRVGGVGPGPPAHLAGGRFENYLQAPPEGLFTNKKSFLFAKRPLRQASRLASGRKASRPASGREVPLFVIFY
jgi:hypothetical protein